MSRLLGRVLLAAFALGPAVGRCDVTFLGPTPYLSASDSPFDMSGLGSTFFLEDFEDGTWNLPPGVVAAPYTIGVPGSFTDSVDADDGVIDGQGNGGHSLWPAFHYYNPTGPPTFNTTMQFNFDTQSLGFVPNAFGFVYTDGVPGSFVSVSLRDVTGVGIGSYRISLEMDPSHMGSTSGDRFIGFVSNRPFAFVNISNTYQSWERTDHFEIDHVQFGYVIPEPSNVRCAAIVLLFVVASATTQRNQFFSGRGKGNCHGEATNCQFRESGGT